MRTSILVTTGILAALAVAGTALAIATGASRSATDVSVCVKDNGQLRLQTPANPNCDPSEQSVAWTVGGEVTDVVAAAPVITSERDGIVTLGLDPGLIEAANSGKIFAGFNDGPGEIPFAVQDPIANGRIAALELPAGAYAVVAKLNVEDAAVDGIGFLDCRLQAGTDFDRRSQAIDSRRDEVVLEVVHRFAEPGEAVLGCIALDATEWEDLKIVAIRANTLSNVFLGG